MTNYRQIFKSTGLLGSVQVLYVLMAVVRNKVAAYFIGAAGLGLSDLYARTIDLLGNATNFGLGLSAVRRLSELYHEETGKNGSPQQGECTAETLPRSTECVELVRTWVLLTALAGTLLCLMFSPVISRVATGSWEYTFSFMLLSPMVGFAALTGGEMAVLKATRHLRQLATASAGGAVMTLLVSAPLYALCGFGGIAPALLLSSAAICCLNMRAAGRIFPYRPGKFRARYLRQGFPLLRLGTAYIVAGVMTSGAEILIRSILARSPQGMAEVGLYAAGFTLTVSYARMIFVAMDADYYPRLSIAVNRHEGKDMPPQEVESPHREMNVTVNRQINSLVVMMAPFLIVFSLALPLIVRLLYTAEFLDVVPMVLCAAPCMYFKAIYTPVAYIPLARGHSLTYMGMELAYDVILCLAVTGGYRLGGLAGAGIGLTLAHLSDLFMVTAVHSLRYGYRMSSGTFLRCFSLLILLLLGLAAAASSVLSVRLLLGILALLLNIPVAYPVLKRLRRK